MRTDHEIPTDAETLDSVDQVLGEVVADGDSRRGMLLKAGGLLAAGTALALPGGATAATRTRGDIVDTLATFEAFGVTLLSEAIRRAPGTPSAAFLGVLRAANTTEFVHLQALRSIGGRQLTNRFWIPEAAFGGNGAGLFATIAQQEEIEISAYLTGVTAAARRRDARDARLLSEALGTEAEHRVLARFASAQLSGSTEVPNNKGFESFKYRSAASATKAVQRLGVGIDARGKAPGRFYDFPGDPRKNGTGDPIGTTRPS
ncbi:hypothetical protein [Patulibacter sp. SYSU D01012]|uniref:hypothetical protein n=1 Tax=Patulibacter sp. SYSU D01012 TaxID=2817381 RepID=UPI001B30E424|nr:hypothetical protein [Patulibacter sp. SYSU D01012]